jgi:hypothetical protein
MATLEQDLRDAFCKATLSEECGPEIDDLALDVTNAIVAWLVKQTFTITEMKASTELESFKIKARGAIKSTVLPGIMLNAGGYPGATTKSGPAMSDQIDLSKGVMMTFGHSYIGRPAMRVKNADTADEWNDYTKVKLDPNKLVDNLKKKSV